jgi:arabinose-5-phosphate isomerase
MKSLPDIKIIARKTIAIELAAVAKLDSSINDDFVNAIKLILSTKGRLIVAGIGKSANIANKMVATFNSTGQPAVFLHAADAIHGDLGNIQEGDVVICISKSGNTPEVKALVPFIKNMGNKIIALTGNPKSFLAIESDFILDVSVEKEACPNNLAPTSSTTAQLVMGDAIAISLLACKDFTEEDFARFHPGGILGKRLNIKVQDLISNYTPKVNTNASINDVIIEISQNRLGVTAVLNDKKLAGIITDGDIRRMLEDEKDISSLCAKDIMSRDPKITKPDDLAYNALKEMEQNNITQLIVIKSEKYLGVIHIHDIIKEGIISQ